MNESFTRALLFVKQGRYREAESYLRQVIQNDPQDPQGFFFLATCLMHDPKNRSEALSMIDQALRLRPNRAFYHAQRANILVLLGRTKEAMREVEQARMLAPNSADSYVAESVVMLVSGNPQAAERAARQALALDAENEAAGDTLADALRMQGKLDESDAQILGLLARNPENPWTHSSAGMLALQKGDGRAAERHFLAALRIDPEHSEAREGLLHAFRARSPFYGAYLKYTFTMERLGRGRRGFVVIGLLLLMQLANITFVGRLAPIGFALVAAYCLFVLWIWVARGVGNLFLLFDQFARHALGAGEKKEAVAVGGGVIVGLTLFAAGLLLKQISLIFLGLTFVSSVFPLSLVFTNRSRTGRMVFGLVGALVYFGGVGSFLLLSLPIGQARDFATSLFVCTMILALISTWIGNIPALRR
jgi:tetratricopeptide (TPR) repeat protein